MAIHWGQSNLCLKDFFTITKLNIQKSKTKHIMPARLSKRRYSEVLKIAKKAHKVLNCRGVTRSDFKF